MHGPIYLDNHATTRTDPRVVEAMLPYFGERFGNASSTSHVGGREAHEAVEAARATIARAIGAQPDEVVFTSGATESNNLAIRGLTDRLQPGRQQLVSVETEHRAVLDPLERLRRRGFRVRLLPVQPRPSAQMGRLDLQQLAETIQDHTILASVMLANNEIGVLQPLGDIADLCAAHGVLLHCDATQAVGKIPLDVCQLGVDLMSFSAHKLHGPQGIGALYIRRRSPSIRLTPLMDGGGQEKGRRSGTLNVPGIVGFAKAIQLCTEEMPAEILRLAQLRQQLYQGLSESVADCQLNGPGWEAESQPGQLRLPGNLNLSFRGVDGQTLMLNCPELALSSGSACSANYPEPSHVLRALGLNDDQVRSSLRFGLGRFNTPAEISRSIEVLAHAIQRLRRLGRLD